MRFQISKTGLNLPIKILQVATYIGSDRILESESLGYLITYIQWRTYYEVCRGAGVQNNPPHISPNLLLVAYVTYNN